MATGEEIAQNIMNRIPVNIQGETTRIYVNAIAEAMAQTLRNEDQERREKFLKGMIGAGI